MSHSVRQIYKLSAGEPSFFEFPVVSFPKSYFKCLIVYGAAVDV